MKKEHEFVRICLGQAKLFVQNARQKCLFMQAEIMQNYVDYMRE